MSVASDAGFGSQDDVRSVVVCAADDVERAAVAGLLRQQGHRAVESGLAETPSVVRLARPEVIVLVVDSNGPGGWQSLVRVQAAAARGTPVLIVSAATARALREAVGVG